MLVITDVQRKPPITGDLFAGKKFWIAQRCPSRADYTKRVTYNGGQVVPLEKHADYIIVDHLRGPPPGGISYRFIDDCIKHETLRDPDQHGHRCGDPVGSVREAGSKAPARSAFRTPFTGQDDNDIYNWVKSCEARGDKSGGNSLYQEFEKLNPRHTWQSWRDRYRKHLEHKPPQSVAANPPPSPPSDSQPARSTPQSESTTKLASKAKPSSKGKQRHVSPTQLSPTPQPEPSPTYEPRSPTPTETKTKPARIRKEPSTAQGIPTSVQRESTPMRNKSTPAKHKFSSTSAMIDLDRFDGLLAAAEDIMNVDHRRIDESWKTWAARAGPPSPAEWASYFDKYVKPVFDELVRNPARSMVYDNAFVDWRVKHPDATVEDWLTYYREVLVPQLPPPNPSEPQQEIKEEPSDGIKAEPNDEVEEFVSESVNGSAEARKTPFEADQWTSLGIAEEEASGYSSRKRRREATEGLKSAVATPSTKRRNTGAEVSFASVQDSVEETPTKKRPGTAYEVDSIPQSPSFPADTPPPESQQEMTIYEDGDGDAGLLDFEAQVRKATAHLDDTQISELLETFRDLPTAPDELDNMAPYEALVMHAVYFFSQGQAEDSQAVWDVGDKLRQLGVYEKLGGDEEEDEGADTDEGNLEEQPDLQLEVEVVEADVDAQEEPTEEQSQPNHADSRQHRTVSTTSPSHQRTKTTPNPQKQPTRPTSSSNGTVMTSFEMTTDPIFDLTTEAQAEAYIASRLEPPYNFPEEHVIIALHATCANSTNMADSVLRWIRQNAGSGRKGRRSSVGTAVLPDQVGVWTEEDDRALRGGVGERRRVEGKHGRQRCRLRREFLAELGG